MTKLTKLRPDDTFNIIFPELVEDITDEEFVRWKKEIDLIWSGYDVEWVRIAERVWGIKCRRREQTDEKETKVISGEFGFGPH